MDTKDLELKLCSDDPIYVAGVPIYPIPIRRIAQIGYMRFNSELRLLCLTEDDIKVLTGDDASDVGVYTYLVASAVRDAELIFQQYSLSFDSVMDYKALKRKKIIPRMKPLAVYYNGGKRNG